MGVVGVVVADMSHDLLVITTLGCAGSAGDHPTILAHLSTGKHPQPGIRHSCTVDHRPHLLLSQ